MSRDQEGVGWRVLSPSPRKNLCAPLCKCVYATFDGFESLVLFHPFNDLVGGRLALLQSLLLRPLKLVYLHIKTDHVLLVVLLLHSLVWVKVYLVHIPVFRLT